MNLQDSVSGIVRSVSLNTRSKNKNKKKKSPFILSDQNNHSKLFADINLDDFKDRRKNLGELEKLYMNLESEYDDIDPDEEYRKISKQQEEAS